MPKKDIREYLKKEEPEKKETEEKAEKTEESKDEGESPMEMLTAALGDSGIDAEKLYAAIKACASK